MSFKFKLVDAHDLIEIQASDQACFSDVWSERQWSNYLSNTQRYTVFGLQDGRRLLGYLCFSKLFDEAELLRIGVLPEYRGSGLANAVMAQAESHLIDLGINKVMLEVRESNVSALALYEKRGFRPDGRRKDYYPGLAGQPSEDALLMSKLLLQE